MQKQHGVFDRFLAAAEKTGDITLRYMFQKEMAKDNLINRLEREKLIEEITQRVLSRIKLTADTAEIFAAIDRLDEKINNLGR